MPCRRRVSAAQRLAGFTIAVAVQIRVALAQQLLGAGIGADLLAAVAAAARGGAIGDHHCSAPPPEIPGPGDAAFLLPDAVAMPAGTELSIQVLLGVTTAEVAPVGKGLAVLHHHQVDVDVADHLRHRAAIAVGGVGLDADLAAPRQALHQIGAGLLTPRGLGCLWRIDAGEADGDGSPSRLNPEGVAVSYREHRGWVAGRGGSDAGFAYPERRRSCHRHDEQGQRALGEMDQGPIRQQLSLALAT
jgi:hypothetical protein